MVGTFFGDVVMPRGACNGQTDGDGTSAGDFFDLSYVTVLKGPQGTLVGRNLIVARKNRLSDPP